MLDGVVEKRLLVRDEVLPDCLITKVRGERVSQAVSDARRKSYRLNRVSDQHIIAVGGIGFAHDATLVPHAGRHVNHSSNPNAELCLVRLQASACNIVSIESMGTIPARSEVVVSYEQVDRRFFPVIIFECHNVNVKCFV